MNKQQKNKKKTSKVMPDVTECIRLYTEENYPLREVAKHFKVSVSTIFGYTKVIQVRLAEES